MNYSPDIHPSRIEIEPPLSVARNLIEASLESDIPPNSLHNCHAIGLDSLVLFDRRSTDNGMARIFWANKGMHPLKNIYNDRGDFTIGVHNHRFQLALIPLVSTLINVEIETGGDELLHEYEFSSGVAGNEMKAIWQRTITSHPLKERVLNPGMAHMMQPEDLHTVRVRDDGVHPFTAWLLLEGPEQLQKSRIYSPNRDLTVSSEDLYLPMHEKTLRSRLQHLLDVTN